VPRRPRLWAGRRPAGRRERGRPLAGPSPVRARNGQRLVGRQRRLVGRRHAVSGVGRYHPAHKHPCCHDVGLVEGIDDQSIPGHDGGHLPEADLSAQVVEVVEAYAHHGVPRGFQGLHSGVMSGIAGKPQVDEQPAVAVDLGRADRLTHHQQDALSGFTGAFGYDLLDSIAEAGDGGGGDEHHPVPAGLRQFAQDGAEQRRGDEVEVGEGGIAADDVGVIEEGRPEAVSLGGPGQAAAGVGDGDEVRAGELMAHQRDHTVVEVLEEREGLHRPSRLGGDDEECPGQVEPLGAQARTASGSVLSSTERSR
jgi:hypothetical protein